MISNWSYSPETSNLGKIWRFLEPCDLEIWRMTLQNNRAPLLCHFKLCVSFHTHWWIHIWVTVRKRSIRVKIDDFFSRVTYKFYGWPSKKKGISSMPLQALCIISYPLVNSILSYSPETLNLGQNRRFFEPCDLEIWRMTLKNNRAPFFATSSFVQHFVPIGEFKLELQSGNAQSGSNSTLFRA